MWNFFLRGRQKKKKIQLTESQARFSLLIKLHTANIHSACSQTVKNSISFFLSLCNFFFSKKECLPRVLCTQQYCVYDAIIIISQNAIARTESALALAGGLKKCHFSTYLSDKLCKLYCGMYNGIAEKRLRFPNGMCNFFLSLCCDNKGIFADDYKN